MNELDKNFASIDRLPPYIFEQINTLKMEARRNGEDIIDFSMGNPDGETPKFIVDKMTETVQRGDTHRYSQSIGIPKFRHVPIGPNINFFDNLEEAIKTSFPKPKMLLLNFPSNPTALCVEKDFFEKVIEIAKENGIWVVHDLAYADLCFDGYKAPSILEVKGAKDIAVEFFTLSKSYNMPGWRVGFCCGNPELIKALARLKSYFDYGHFTPVQVAGIEALNKGDDFVKEVCELYKIRRDVLCDGLNNLGWEVEKPKATMFVWAKIPKKFNMKSMEFSELLLKEAKIAVSPGLGFGVYGDDFVRFSLIENEHRTKQALKNLKKIF